MITLSSHITILPVIHYSTYAIARSNAKMALELGCDGVFLISDSGGDAFLVSAAQRIKDEFPGLQVGVNHVTLGAPESLRAVLAAGLDMTWSDRTLASDGHALPEGRAVRALLENHDCHSFYCGVAFKGQAPERDPELAAGVVGNELGLIPTTSGHATGIAADTRKVRDLRGCLQPGRRLALAGGICADNVLRYVPLATDILVRTGISRDERHFDWRRLGDLVDAVRTRHTTSRIVRPALRAVA
jgi:uncharacterized protein